MANLSRSKTSRLKFIGKYTPLAEGCLEECSEGDAGGQGKTLEKTRNRLKEAVKFHLEVFGPEKLASYARKL